MALQECFEPAEAVEDDAGNLRRRRLVDTKIFDLFG